MWFTIVSIFYVLVCTFLVLVVLLQQGKGGGMGSAFGGGGSNTVFGGAGAGNFLTRLTAVAATLFMVLSAVLAYMSTSGERHMRVVEGLEQEQTPDGIEGTDEGGALPTPTPVVPPSEDTTDEAEADPALDDLEEAVEADAPAAEEPVEEPAPEPEPAAEEPEAPEPEEAAAPAPRPARPRPARPAAPAAAAEEPAPAAPAPAAAPEPAPAE